MTGQSSPAPFTGNQHTAEGPAGRTDGSASGPAIAAETDGAGGIPEARPYSPGESPPLLRLNRWWARVPVVRRGTSGPPPRVPTDGSVPKPPAASLVRTPGRSVNRCEPQWFAGGEILQPGRVPCPAPTQLMLGASPRGSAREPLSVSAVCPPVDRCGTNGPPPRVNPGESGPETPAVSLVRPPVVRWGIAGRSTTEAKESRGPFPVVKRGGSPRCRTRSSTEPRGLA